MAQKNLAEDGFVVPFQEAIDYYRQKITLPTRMWRDIEGRSHDRAFVVAGAIKEGLLADLRAAIEKGVVGQSTLEQFRKEFAQIVEKHGWTGYAGSGSVAGRAWRTRVIYETNLTTAYAAGRYAQMTDPDIVKVFGHWRYRHAYYRVPERPREEHLNWDGLVLAYDDPWWDTHYPPNGWLCSCGVEGMSKREMKAEGIEPGEAPPTGTRGVRDPATGETVQVPNGIDFGWDHAPGKDWSKGIVPKELAVPLKPSVGPAAPVTPAPPLAEIARPFAQPKLPPGLEERDYVKAFLKPFGADFGKPVLFRDASGQVLPVSDGMFTDGSGVLKFAKRGRGPEMARLAETIIDPDEIWVDWSLGKGGVTRLIRRYLRLAPTEQGTGTAGFSMFEWSSSGWSGVTAFPATKGVDKVNTDYLERQRAGALLYRRKVEDKRQEE